jgi:hypothetical protein
VSTYVFLGPSLGVDAATATLDAHFLPPVRQGDVYELVRHGMARRICLIDGYFSQTPAVWHKELLYALENGVTLLGAASMGALRAAEMESFGMRGVGDIFEAYRDGVFPDYPDGPFEDDDEVAVVHGPAEAGYRAASTAMVNLRATLSRAMREGLLQRAERDALTDLAKARFYPERGLQSLLADGRAAGLHASMLHALAAWWPDAFVDLKARDALRALRFLAEEDDIAPAVGVSVARSAAFEALREEVAARHRLTPPPAPAEVEELRVLQPQRYRHALARVHARLLAVHGEADDGPDRVLQRCMHTALARRGLDVGDAQLWRARLQPQFTAFVQAMPQELLDAHLVAVLREDGDLEALAERAQRKTQWLAGASVPAAAELDGLAQLQLQEWYFGSVLGQWIPDDVEGHTREMGFADIDAFHDALLREYTWREAGEPTPAGTPGGGEHAS